MMSAAHQEMPCILPDERDGYNQVPLKRRLTEADLTFRWTVRLFYLIMEWLLLALASESSRPCALGQSGLLVASNRYSRDCLSATLPNCGKVLKLNVPSRCKWLHGGRGNNLGYGNNRWDVTMGNPQPSLSLERKAQRLNGDGLRAFIARGLRYSPAPRERRSQGWSPRVGPSLGKSTCSGETGSLRLNSTQHGKTHQNQTQVWWTDWELFLDFVVGGTNDYVPLWRGGPVPANPFASRASERRGDTVKLRGIPKATAHQAVCESGRWPGQWPRVW